ncbi:MAG: hypothetical protein NTW81_05760 [Actinobacteria bacterium]|nr:hypothetical protein [Actinomycetota bacterium]
MAKRIAFILTAVLLVYLGFAFSRGIDLLRTDNGSVKLLGLCVLVLPMLGGWLVIREVRFGFKSSQMGQQVSENLLPSREIKPRSPQADEYLEGAVARTKEAQEVWQNWFCVALGYDLVGERKLARESMQYAVELYAK